MLGPGIGGFEVVVIALAALIVVGPKDLPMLMRKVGQFLGRARKMAAEFRASFDDMARQSELDDLRREVEALRTGQVGPLDKDTKATFADIKKGLYEPPPVPAAKPTAITDTPPMTEPTLPDPDAPDAPAAPKKSRASKAAAAGAEPAPAKPRAPRRKKTAE